MICHCGRMFPVCPVDVIYVRTDFLRVHRLSSAPPVAAVAACAKKKKIYSILFRSQKCMLDQRGQKRKGDLGRRRRVNLLSEGGRGEGTHTSHFSFRGRRWTVAVTPGHSLCCCVLPLSLSLRNRFSCVWCRPSWRRRTRKEETLFFRGTREEGEGGRGGQWRKQNHGIQRTKRDEGGRRARRRSSYKTFLSRGRGETST